jgi:hypothetical protein
LGRRIGRGSAHHRNGDRIAGDRSAGSPTGHPGIGDHLAKIIGKGGAESADSEIDGGASAAGQPGHDPRKIGVGCAGGIDRHRNPGHRYGPLTVVRPLKTPSQWIGNVIRNRDAAASGTRARGVANHDGHGNGAAIGIIRRRSAGRFGEARIGRNRSGRTGRAKNRGRHRVGSRRHGGGAVVIRKGSCVVGDMAIVGSLH